MTKIKVVCVYGKFGENSDFVLEPAVDSDKDAFWIEKVKGDEDENWNYSTNRILYRGFYVTLFYLCSYKIKFDDFLFRDCISYIFDYNKFKI